MTGSCARRCIPPVLRRPNRRRAPVRTSATPGMIDRNGAVRSTARPSAIMPPQVTRFGSPRPRKESEASISTALATMIELSASTGGRALGRISRKAISTGCMPMTRAPATKSRSRIDRISARAMRAGPVQAPSAIAADHGGERRAGDADEGQRQQKVRHGLECIGQAHQHVVDDAAGETGRGADKAADHDRCGRRGKPDSERRARTVEQFGEHVAPEPVGAQRIRPVVERRDQRRAGDCQRIGRKEQRARGPRSLPTRARMTSAGSASGEWKKRETLTLPPRSRRRADRAPHRACRR